MKTLVAPGFERAGAALRKVFYATQERVEALKRGADTARVLVFLGAGTAWVWQTAQEHFPLRRVGQAL